MIYEIYFRMQPATFRCSNIIIQHLLQKHIKSCCSVAPNPSYIRKPFLYISTNAHNKTKDPKKNQSSNANTHTREPAARRRRASHMRDRLLCFLYDKSQNSPERCGAGSTRKFIIIFYLSRTLYSVCVLCMFFLFLWRPVFVSVSARAFVLFIFG